MTRTPSAAGGPEYTLLLDRVPVEHVLGGADCLADLYQLAVAGACSLADGALSGALALTRDHVAVQAAVRPSARRLPGGRPAGRRRLHRVAHPAPGHGERVLAA